MGATTNGKVKRDVDTGTDRDALLFDFGVESFKLGTEHTKYLDELLTFLKAPATPPMTVSIDGYASHTGSAAYNQSLSENREHAVEDYLRVHSRVFDSGRLHTINRRFNGFSGKPPGENPLFRSVRIVVHKPGVIPPPKPVHPPTPPKPPEPAVTSRNFFCSDASTDIVNVLDRFFSFEQPIKVLSVQDMVGKALRRLDITPGTKIENLVVGGHGSSGFQAVGCGKDCDPTGAKSLQVDPYNPNQLLGPAAAAMVQLKGKFTAKGVVSLTGCEVARGGAGLELLQVVSKTVGTAAQAAIASQRPLIPGWEGDLYRCNGNVCWIQLPGIL